MTSAQVSEAFAAAAPSELPALRARIEERTATVAVVGLGYVGLPLLVAAGNEGFAVIGVTPTRPNESPRVGEALTRAGKPLRSARVLLARPRRPARRPPPWPSRG